MGILKEFRTFIMKGNAIDMAVGLIVGAAFGVVVKSLVDDVIMPPLGYVMGGVDFSEYQLPLAESLQPGDKHPLTGAEVTKEIPAPAIRYGLFVNALITLVIQGFAVFLVVKSLNSLKRKAEEAPPAPAEPPADVQLLTEIRDLLKRG